MTKEEKIDVYSMRLDGKTLQEIGDKYGLSKERIRQILSASVHLREPLVKRCKYPGIGKWLIEHNETIASLAEKSGINPATAYSALSTRTKNQTIPKKDSIDKILRATGLTYEEAFFEPPDSREEDAP